MGMLSGPFGSWKSKGSRNDSREAATMTSVDFPTEHDTLKGDATKPSPSNSISSSSSGRSIEPRSNFLDLPENIRDLVCQLAGNLSLRLEKIATTGSLRAKNIIPIGREILDLSAMCCVARRMLAGLVPQSIPTEDELNQHISVCEKEKCCGCCSVLAMMDIEGDVMRSFPEDLDGSCLPVSIQAAGIAIVISEVEKALAALDSLLYDDGKDVIVGQVRKPQTLETMVLQLSSGLRMLFRKLKGQDVFLRMKKTRARWRVKKSQEGERLGRRPPVYYKNCRSMSARTDCSAATG